MAAYEFITAYICVNTVKDFGTYLPLLLRWQDFLNAYLIDQVFSLEID